MHQPKHQLAMTVLMTPDMANFSGNVHGGTILEMKDAEFDFAVDLNIRSMIRTIRAVLPGMLERKDGAIINMASVASSTKGVPNRFAYGVTKAAVIGLTKAVSPLRIGGMTGMLMRAKNQVTQKR